MRAKIRIVRRPPVVCWTCFAFMLLLASAPLCDEAAPGNNTVPGERGQRIRQLARTGLDGSRSQEARQAWQRLVECDVAVLPEILAAMKDADAVGVNWLRTAYDAILDREAASGIPVERLMAVIVDPEYDGRARRLAWSTLESQRPRDARQLLTTLLEDAEFRLQAVQMLIDDAEAAVEADDQQLARQLYRKAFEASVDYEQICGLAERLKHLDDPVDLRAKLGVPKQWQLLGPLPGHDQTGFQRTYPPEEHLDLDAEHTGVAGPIRWQTVVPGEDGQVDLNRVFGISSDTVAYAYARFDAPRSMDAQLLVGADDNVAVWFNGQMVFAFPHYHQHLRVDRFRIPVRLAEGGNTLLLKVCQSVTPPDYPRPNQWQFVCRIVDLDGKPVPLRWAQP